MGSSVSVHSHSALGATLTSDNVLNVLGASRIAGKHVVITGGSGGLGLETARVLAKAGANVTITVRTDEQGKKSLEKIGAREGSLVNYELMDLSDLVSVKACA